MVNIKGKYNAPLTVTSIIMLIAFVGSCAGIFLDHRIITGVPAWLKPAKFAISTAIFSGTMAWLFRYVKIWPHFVRAMGWVLAVILILEVGIIDIQAARGVTSHFNVTTPLDLTLFVIMGAAIGNLWLASLGILIALFFQKFEDPAWGWWLRMGMLVTVLGSAAGGIMLGVSAHTVGAPDGGPGLLGLGWSTQHGDLRVPHFLGLHGVQVIPLLGWLVLRRRKQARLAFVAAASYITLIAILTWQALRGQSVVHPDAATLLALAIWLAATIAAVFCLWGLRFQVVSPLSRRQMLIS
jgi:hypothetical protein